MSVLALTASSNLALASVLVLLWFHACEKVETTLVGVPFASVDVNVLLYMYSTGVHCSTQELSKNWK